MSETSAIDEMNLIIWYIFWAHEKVDSAHISNRFFSILIITIISAFPFGAEITGAPPYGVPESEVPNYTPISGWTRPNVPPRVGLQVGHWKNDEVPDELENLRRNTGASGGGKMEWEVNYALAIEIEKILENEGIEVDIIPTTVPPNYWADVF